MLTVDALRERLSLFDGRARLRADSSAFAFALEPVELGVREVVAEADPTAPGRYVPVLVLEPVPCPRPPCPSSP